MNMQSAVLAPVVPGVMSGFAPLQGAPTAHVVGVRFEVGIETVYGPDDSTRDEEREYIVIPILGGYAVTRRLATDQDKRTYAGAYNAFVNGRPTPLDGTPLEQLPGITERVVKLAALREIRTIEQMASEQGAVAMGPGGREWQAKCRAWLEAKAGATLLDQSAALAAMQDQIARLTAALAATQSEMKVRDEVIARLSGAPSPAASPEALATMVDRRDDVIAMGADPMSDGDGLADA